MSDQTKCANPRCATAATHYPAISFGPIAHREDAAFPYRLEVPRGMCPGCQDGFDPAFFFGDTARAAMATMIEREHRVSPDFTRLKVEWVAIADPALAEIAGGGHARLWF